MAASSCPIAPGQSFDYDGPTAADCAAKFTAAGSSDSVPETRYAAFEPMTNVEHVNDLLRAGDELRRRTYAAVYRARLALETYDAETGRLIATHESALVTLRAQRYHANLRYEQRASDLAHSQLKEAETALANEKDNGDRLMRTRDRGRAPIDETLERALMTQLQVGAQMLQVLALARNEAWREVTLTR
jgi:hypothetical protein